MSNNTTASGKETPVELLGNLDDIPIRSGSNPIVLFQQADYLDAQFDNRLGIITVQIFDEMNRLVYQEVINTSVETRAQISTLEFESGNYLIRFTNVLGKYLYGNFEVE